MIPLRRIPVSLRVGGRKTASPTFRLPSPAAVGYSMGLLSRMRPGSPRQSVDRVACVYVTGWPRRWLAGVGGWLLSRCMG